ncbi:hypothetical protein PMAYCL1PPCAC_14652 [Pristionchus mayeri]|uniref:Nuclear receptor domain-containing protein n=1 Tax=Pristionchus mayeri TaxID=1317129 RepID=A0AAN4ZTY8_9BILA|nr:hypothetical protein PMAYCL1PPCAC_14652 [Pristionchus mayeri]
MPRPKSKRTERACLVCGGITKVLHMGMDVCRACTVFYRRSKGKNFICRSNTSKCPVGEECRKCRFDRLDRLAKKSGSNNDESDDSSDDNVTTKANLAENQPISDRLTEEPRSSLSPDSSSVQNSKPRHGTPLINKLSEKYKVMCDTRLACELSSRVDPPHPMRVYDRNHPLYPATYDSYNRANRIFLTTILQFGVAAFPEFATFNDREKWTVVTNFFTRFRTFDAGYRADKTFPDDMEKGFIGYTLVFSEEAINHFYDDCPNVGDREEATRIHRDRFKTNLRPNREAMRRIGHRHEEFIASLAMMFWSTEGLDVSPDVTRASELYKEIILRELHIYYREDLQLEDYAYRLGEVLMFLQTCEQRAGDMDKHYELLGLLNVFSDDTVAYRLTNV